LSDNTGGFLIRNVDKDTREMFSRYARAQGLRNADMIVGLIQLYEVMSVLAIKQDNEHAKDLLDRSGLKPTHIGN
jgi:hypothetical protein